MSAALSGHLELLFEASDFSVKDADCLDDWVALYGLRPPSQPCLLLAKMERAEDNRREEKGLSGEERADGEKRQLPSEVLEESAFGHVLSADPPFVRRHSNGTSHVFSVSLSSAGAFAVGANSSPRGSTLRLWVNSPLLPSAEVRVELPKSRGDEQRRLCCRPRVRWRGESEVALLSPHFLRRLSRLYEETAHSAVWLWADEETLRLSKAKEGFALEKRKSISRPSLRDVLRSVAAARTCEEEKASFLFASLFVTQSFAIPTRDGKAKACLTLVSPRRLRLKESSLSRVCREERECQEGTLPWKTLPATEGPPFVSWLRARPASPECLAAPLLLSVYAAYKTPLCAAFDSASALLLQRGWRVGFLHLRGGGEALGEDARDGRGSLKLLSVLDLQDALAFLLAAGIAIPDKTALKAESAGGVVGAWLALLKRSPVAQVLSRFPSSDPLAALSRLPLVKALLLDRAFLDARSATSDWRLPLAALESDEWLGAEAAEKAASASDQRQAFEENANAASLWSACEEAAAESLSREPRSLVGGYAVVEHLQRLSSRSAEGEEENNSLPSPMPAVLVSCAVEDPRAPSSHSAKFVGELLRLTRGAAPVCLRILEESAGHLGPLTWNAQRRKAAEEVCFLEGALLSEWPS